MKTQSTLLPNLFGRGTINSSIFFTRHRNKLKRSLWKCRITQVQQSRQFWKFCSTPAMSGGTLAGKRWATGWDVRVTVPLNQTHKTMFLLHVTSNCLNNFLLRRCRDFAKQYFNQALLAVKHKHRLKTGQRFDIWYNVGQFL